MVHVKLMSVAAVAAAAFVGSLALAQTPPATAPVAAPEKRAQTPVFRPRDEDPKEYAEGPGRDDTFYACTACHAFKIVAQQGLSREQWDESLTWMTTRHKMQDIQGKDRTVILDYLATHYGPKAPGGGRPAWKNPFN